MITAAAESDPVALPLPEEQMNAMAPMRMQRGRPELANQKLLVSIHYSPEVIDCFRVSVAGWQARMDAVLKEYVEAHSTVDAMGDTHQDTEDGSGVKHQSQSFSRLLSFGVGRL